MKTSRLALAGAMALAASAAVWWMVSDSPEASGDARRVGKDAAAGNAAAGANGAADSREPGAASATARAGSKTTPGESVSPFLHRQSLERDGYEAAGDGVAAALQRLVGITGPTERAAFLRGMFAHFAENGSMEALQAIKGLNKAERGIALRALSENRKGALAEAPNQTEAIEGMLVGKSATSRLYTMAMKEAEISAHTAWGPRMGIGTEAMMILGLADQPELAAGLARELLKPQELGGVLAEIARQEVSRNPAHALSLGEGLEGKARTDFLARVASGWGEADGAAAWAWAGGQGDTALRDSLQEAVIRGMVGREPLSAAQHAAQMVEGEGKKRSLDVVGQSWGGMDTQAALDWANGLPNSNDRDAALGSIRKAAPVGIGAMLGTDPDGYPMIQDVVPGGAASEVASLGKGARIAAVYDAQGQPVDLQGKELQEAISLLRGAAGTPVTMEIIPAGSTTRQVVVISRRQVIHKR